MYLFVRGHVFVCQGSCICVLGVMYLCVRGIDFVSFYDLDKVVYFAFHFITKEDIFPKSNKKEKTTSNKRGLPRKHIMS